MADSSERSSEKDATIKLMGSDPWMRFDVWAARAWEAVVEAVEIAKQNGAPIGGDDSLDPRIGALFYSADLAKDFAEMVNPLIAVSSVDFDSNSDPSDLSKLAQSIINSEDLD